MASPTGRPIRGEVLDLAEVWIRRVGANGFSYGDLANELGIKAPSIHHHFRTKDDLVAEVAERYRERFAERVAALDGNDERSLLAGYAELFVSAARDDLMCLCGAMVVDWLTVGERSRSAVAGFFDDQRQWLTTTVESGMQAGRIRSDIDASAVAQALLASLEGAMLMTRAGSDAALPATATNTLLALLDAVA